MRVAAKSLADLVERVTQRKSFEDVTRPGIHAADQLLNENIPVNPVGVDRASQKIGFVELAGTVGVPFLELGQDQPFVRLKQVGGQITNLRTSFGNQLGYRGNGLFQQPVSGD